MLDAESDGSKLCVCPSGSHILFAFATKTFAESSSMMTSVSIII